MPHPPVRTLLGAVRRRLWRGHFVAAVRLALWCSAGLMLLAVAVHVAARPVPVGAVLFALAMLWAWMLARAGWRRPSDPACALWADRHLGGACAYTTWLEMENGTHRLADVRAVRWLELWASARVPDGLRLLAERPDPVRLSRPLLAMLVCTALATFVLALPGLTPISQQPGAALSPPGATEGSTPMIGTPAPAELVKEMANALRSAQSRVPPEQGAADQAPAAGPGKTDGESARPTAQAGAAPSGDRAGDRAAASAAPSGTSVDATPAPGAVRTSGADSGPEAGNSRDERADVGVSRALRGTIAVQRFESRAVAASAQSQSDMDRLASYDDELSMPGAAALRVGPAPAPATPPAATESMRLTPTETSYVQAWMKASGPRR